jgi:hypothetical protein
LDPANLLNFIPGFMKGVVQKVDFLEIYLFGGETPLHPDCEIHVVLLLDNNMVASFD